MPAFESGAERLFGRPPMHAQMRVHLGGTDVIDAFSEAAVGELGDPHQE